MSRGEDFFLARDLPPDEGWIIVEGIMYNYSKTKDKCKLTIDAMCERNGWCNKVEMYTFEEFEDE